MDLDVENEDDICIVWKNSPLHAYLTECGFKSSIQTLSVENDISKEKNAANVNQPQNSNACDYLNDDPDYYHSLLDLIPDILKSTLIFPEDVTMVEAFLSYQPQSRRSIKFKKMTLNACVLGLLSFYLNQVIGKAAFILPTLPTITFFYNFSREFYLEYQRRKIISCLLDNMRKFSKLLQKSVRFVQDGEILQRERKFLSEIYSELTQEGCPMAGFQHCIRMETKRAICCLRNLVKEFIREIPLERNADDCGYYISALKDEDLGLGVEENLKSNYLGVNVNLKWRLKYVYLLMQSELLRRLALSFIPTIRKNPLPQHKLFRSLSNLNEECCKWERALHFKYKTFYTLTEGDSVPGRGHKIKADVESEACVKIRCLSGHLRLALMECYDLEKRAEAGEDVRGDASREILVIFRGLNSVVNDYQKFVYKKEEAAKPTVEVLLTTIEGSEETKIKDEEREEMEMDQVFLGISTREADKEGWEDLDPVESAKTRYTEGFLRELKAALVAKRMEWQEREKTALSAKNLQDFPSEEEVECGMENEDGKDFTEFPLMPDAVLASQIVGISRAWGLSKEECFGDEF